MALTNFPFGVTSFGIPVLSGDTSVTTGTAFFVDSVTGSASYDGKTPATPFASLVTAIAAATASKGDVIFCLPGHTEAVIAAGTITVSKAGLRIVGLGNGRQRAIITYTTAAAASFDITAANVTVENLVFNAVGVDAVTAAVNISAADVTLKNCEMITADATNQVVLGILTTAAADRLTLQNCFIHGTTDAGTSVAVRIVGGANIRVLNCIIDVAGTTTLGCIQNVTTPATQIWIDGCVLNNSTASSTVVITLHASCTGGVTNCRMGILSGTAPIVGAALNLVGGNYYKAAAGVAAGTLL